jgi:hypothetical protein
MTTASLAIPALPVLLVAALFAGARLLLLAALAAEEVLRLRLAELPAASAVVAPQSWRPTEVPVVLTEPNWVPNAYRWTGAATAAQRNSTLERESCLKVVAEAVPPGPRTALAKVALRSTANLTVPPVLTSSQYRLWGAAVRADQARSCSALVAAQPALYWAGLYWAGLESVAAYWAVAVEAAPRQKPIAWVQALETKTFSIEDHRIRRDPIRPCHS